MVFVDELFEEMDKKFKKKNKKDKSADVYPSFVVGNMLFRNVCSSDLAGTKKISTDTRI
jgi:hypothetical protein